MMFWQEPIVKIIAPSKTYWGKATLAGEFKDEKLRAELAENKTPGHHLTFTQHYEISPRTLHDEFFKPLKNRGFFEKDLFGIEEPPPKKGTAPPPQDIDIDQMSEDFDNMSDDDFYQK